VTVGYDANERHDGDQWSAGRTNIVLPRLVAAMTTTLLRSKLFVCSVFALFLLAPSMCVVFCVLSLLWCCFTARHCVARLVTALLRFVDAALVWLLATMRMNGVMATNGLRNERM